MRRETIVVEITFKAFEPGEEVRPTSRRCCLPDGVYVVERCECPTAHCPDMQESIVFLKGHQYGVGTEYLLPADDDCFNCWRCGKHIPPGRNHLGACEECNDSFTL